MQSTVETHPMRARIVEMAIAGVSSRKIGRSVSPPLDFHAVQRYIKSVIKPAAHIVMRANQSLTVPSQQAVQAVAVVDPYLARMAADRAERARVKALACPQDATLETSDLRAWTAADRNEIAATELEMRACGVLDSRQPGESSVNLVIQLALPRLEPELVAGVIDLKAEE